MKYQILENLVNKKIKNFEFFIRENKNDLLIIDVKDLDFNIKTQCFVCEISEIENKYPNIYQTLKTHKDF